MNKSKYEVYTQRELDVITNILELFFIEYTVNKIADTISFFKVEFKKNLELEKIINKCLEYNYKSMINF